MRRLFAFALILALLLATAAMGEETFLDDTGAPVSLEAPTRRCVEETGQVLADRARQEGGCFLPPDKLRFHRAFQDTAERVEASLTLTRVQREDDAELTRTVVLHQTYEAGQIYHVAYEQLPTVTVWPCVPCLLYTSRCV